MNWFKTPKQLADERLEQQSAMARRERDQHLQQARAWLERHRDEQAMDIAPTLACSEQDLLVYIQALRDVPQQEGFPVDVVWPQLILTQEIHIETY